MENMSHSFAKKSNYHGSGFITTPSKSIYDDVFGGPPKFGVPTLAPRYEDYTEIFGGFHSSRASSIPVLDLPVLDEDNDRLSLDVQSCQFDYSEIFGGFNVLDFPLSFEDLVRQSTSGYDSSDEAWYDLFSFSLFFFSKVRSTRVYSMPFPLEAVFTACFFFLYLPPKEKDIIHPSLSFGFNSCIFFLIFFLIFETVVSLAKAAKYVRSTAFFRIRLKKWLIAPLQIEIDKRKKLLLQRLREVRRKFFIFSINIGSPGSFMFVFWKVVTLSTTT